MSFNETVKSKIDFVRDNVGLDEARAVGGSALALLTAAAVVKELGTEPAFAQPAIERVVAVDYNDISSADRLTYSPEQGFAVFTEDDPILTPTPTPTPTETPLPTPTPTVEAPVTPPPVAQESAMSALELDEYCGEQATQKPLIAKMESNEKHGSDRITRASYLIKLAGIDQQCIGNGSVSIIVNGIAEGVNGKTFFINKWTKAKTPFNKGSYMPMTGNKPSLAPNSATTQKVRVKPTKLVKGTIANGKGEFICAPGKAERKTKLEVSLSYEEKDGLYQQKNRGRPIQSEVYRFKGFQRGRGC